MEERHRFKIVWDYAVVSLFVVTSGVVFWKGVLSAAISYSLLLIVAYVNAFVINKRTKDNPSVIYIYGCALLCILNYIVNFPSFEDRSIIGFFFSMIATYLIISRYNYYYFRKLLTNIVFIIVLVGIPIFLLCELSMLPVGTMTSVDGVSYVSCGIYTLGWAPYYFDRFSGIWHEPGACQIILNTVLWMHFDCIHKWQWEKNQLWKCLVILSGSLITMSTGSYMVLMLLCVAVLLKLELRGRYKYVLFLLAMTIVPILIYILFNSPVIQNKLFDAEGESVSKVARTADILALWQMSLDRPILGYGIGTVDFWQTAEEYGNVTTSAGVLAYIASLGFSWFFLYLVFLYRGCRKIIQGSGVLFLVIAVVIMQFNELYIECPISCVFLFEYAMRYENRIKYETNINNNCNL